MTITEETYSNTQARSGTLWYDLGTLRGTAVLPAGQLSSSAFSLTGGFAYPIATTGGYGAK